MTWEGAGMAWEGAGMAWEGAGMTWEGAGMAWEGAGMTWVSAGMTGSPTCCGPGAIHATRVNGTISAVVCVIPAKAEIYGLRSAAHP